MEKQKMRKALKLVFETAPVDWQEKADKMKPEELTEIEGQLEALSERAAMLAGYLTERHGYGCGDQGHEAGVKRANKYLKKIHCDVFGFLRSFEFKF